MAIKKILFITNRNIINTCGELRLIKNRTEFLHHVYGFLTDFLVLTNKNVTIPEPIDGGGFLVAFRYSMNNPISIFKAKRELKQTIHYLLDENKYSIIIISGADLLSLIQHIKKIDPHIVTIADCHGAYEELIEFDSTSEIKTFIRHQMYRVWKNKEKKFLQYFDHVMSVSNGLKKYLINEYAIEATKIHVIPCAISRKKYTQIKHMQFRMLTRAKYGIKESDILFIYSGGVSKWQCIDETVDVFFKIREIISGAKLLLLSGNKKYISKFLGNGILIDSLKADEVEQALPASDFAFLLREDYVTNRVAFPNKFLEYVYSGAKIITTPFVEDIAENIQKYELGYVMKSTKYEKALGEYVKANLRHYGTDMNARKKLLHDVGFENSLAFFNEL